MLKNRATLTLVALFTSLLMVVSCSDYQDEGNYSYKDINEVTFKGLEKEYSVIKGEILNISPKLEFTKDSKKYSYKWQVYKPLLVSQRDLNLKALKDLSTEKDLNIPLIELSPGKYTAYYTVKDLDTGVPFQYKFDLDVLTPVYEGWLLLNEVNGSPRLDMVSFLNGKRKLMYDVLKEMKSKLVLKGEPKFVYTYDKREYGYRIYVSTTGNGTVGLGADDFNWDEDLPDHKFWNPSHRISSEILDKKKPKDFRVDNIFFKTGEYFTYLMEGGDFYYSNRSVAYDLPVNEINDVPFKVSPIFVDGGRNSSVFYDTTNKRFLRFNENFNAQNSRIIKFSNPKKRKDKLFDYNNTGKDLVYMASNNYLNPRNGVMVFAILKDASTNKDYLAVFNTGDFKQFHYGEITATDFDRSTSYAISDSDGYLLYSVGSKLYEYDFLTKKTKLMLDKGSEEITLIKFQHFFKYNDNYNKLRKQLIVCSYDPSKPEGSNGTMELYEVPSVHGDLVLKTKYTGFGKIKSISYRER